MIRFLLLILSLNLHGGIEKYFKKAENKTAVSNIGNIDFIYMINLDKRPERYERTMEALKPYGINPYRFSAVNGWELDFRALDELGIIFESGMSPGPLASVYRHAEGKEYLSNEVMKEIGVCYYSHGLPRGSIGCILSHLSVLQDAYDSDYEIIWVIEDDIKVVSNPHELSFLIATLQRYAPNWDVFFTDNEVKAKDGSPVPSMVIRPRPLLQLQSLEYYRERTPITRDIVKIGMRFGSASMIVRRSGMKKILDFFKKYKIYFPYDIDYFLVPGIHLYALNRDIVTNIPDGASDNASPTY